MSEFNEWQNGESVREWNNPKDFTPSMLQNELVSYFGIKETPAESKEITEAREYKVNECAEVTKQHFTQEVLNEWANYTIEQKHAILDSYVKGIGKELGIEMKGVVIEPLNDAYGYNNGDGTIHLDLATVSNPAEMIRVIDTAAHETRHQFQNEVIQNHEKFGIDELTAKEWEVGRLIYTTNGPTSYDPWGYFYNPMETDARFFGESMVRELTRGLIAEISSAVQSETTRQAASLEMQSSKYDDNGWNIKAMQEALERGDYGNAKKHADRIH